jgi:hypothetical protein
MPAGELHSSCKRLYLTDCPIKRLWCLYVFPCISSSVAMRVKYPNFIGSIKVPASLQRKLLAVCIGHVTNVQQLATNRPARIYSITVYGSLRQYDGSMPVSRDPYLGQHGSKDLEYVSHGGYGELSCQKTYRYPMQTIVSKRANELQHLDRGESRSWNFNMVTVDDSYPRQFLLDVNPYDRISAYAYGEQQFL